MGDQHGAAPRRRTTRVRVACATMLLGSAMHSFAGAAGQAAVSPEAIRVQAPSHCLTQEEEELVRLINEYRAANGLKAVPLSVCLTEVAKSHVYDLEQNAPARGADPRGQACSLHSWSDGGPWTAVCYTRDHANAKNMWGKPREVTGDRYLGNGFENAYWTSRVASSLSALAGWKRSAPHNALLLEQGTWQGSNWPAMGVAISEHFAVVWFGDRPDTLGTVGRCETQRDRFLKSLLPAGWDQANTADHAQKDAAGSHAEPGDK